MSDEIKPGTLADKVLTMVWAFDDSRRDAVRELAARVAELERELAGLRQEKETAFELADLKVCLDLDCGCCRRCVEDAEEARDAAIKERDDAQAHLIRLHASATKFAAFFEK